MLWDHEDWLKAEAELLHPVHLDIAESDEAVTVRAEVNGQVIGEAKLRVELRKRALPQ